MKPEIKELIEISRFYGKERDFVIGGGGNTSYKEENTLWIKASGYSLADLDEDALVALDRGKLRVISMNHYPDEPLLREELVRKDLSAAIIDGSRKRPSVETSLHDIINYRFVVHLHPTIINGILCSRNSGTLISKSFGKRALFVPYTDPGYTLFKKLENDIKIYREKYSAEPQIIFLENHGVFVSANTTDEIRKIYDEIMAGLTTGIKLLPQPEPLPENPEVIKLLPRLRMILSDENIKVIRHRNNPLIAENSASSQDFDRISHPFTPDMVVYCRSRYLYLEQTGSAERVIESLKHQMPRFKDEYGFMPVIIVMRNLGIFAVADTVASADTALDTFEDLIRVSHYAGQSGGRKFLDSDQIAFIDRWEVENYRRIIAKGEGHASKLENKIAIVTGGAQGFGAGIAEALYKLSVNVMVADLNEDTGTRFVAGLSEKSRQNMVQFFRTDVSDPESVRRLIDHTVSQFGGLDILISNAGVLTAGGLDEIEPDVFEKTTGVNYNGYFYCVKYASEAMKLQNLEKPEYFTDIIQINSKSGLRGSNRNFAYAGSKFGSIGLTQSFALELAPFRIKVNAVCPGNFYEGPLWSDPHNGLFVQYLRTGKVPGARTAEDVKKHYEAQVPLKRGCRLGDVMKAILYIIDQEYETGQAIPVTGGQVMLG